MIIIKDLMIITKNNKVESNRNKYNIVNNEIINNKSR
jgi:hypothetical protein